MKVFNLSCQDDHRFEGWFDSAAEYDTQLASGLLQCPICGSEEIRKLPAAPHLNISRDTAEPARPSSAPDAEQAQASWLRAARHIVENTEDVGEAFSEEARRIHYQEVPSRGIRGVATSAERAALEEEGIEVFAFPLPKVVKTPLQ